MLKILYICTHNRCRSILSEAITNQDGGGNVIAESAGSHPVKDVHPLSIKYLSEAGYATDSLKSQSWDNVNNFHPDLVITVCDAAAQESCPVWFGQAIQLYWQLADPSRVEGTDEQKKWAFVNTIDVIKKRVALLVQHADLTPQQVAQKLLSVGAVMRSTPA